MFSIPNIYKGNYKLLAIPTVILLLASILMLPNIKMGIDFTGGTLISLSLNQMVDSTVLKTQLDSEGIRGTVRVFDTAVGPKAEIELCQSQDLV